MHVSVTKPQHSVNFVKVQALNYLNNWLIKGAPISTTPPGKIQCALQHLTLHLSSSKVTNNEEIIISWGTVH